MKNLLFLSLLFVSSTSVFAIEKVIYGVDDREDVFEVQNNLHVSLSESTAAMITKRAIQNIAGNRVKLLGRSLQNGSKVCSTERFSKQMAVASCSGFLVGKDLIATAGHCIKSKADCRNYKWVFDYKVSHSDQFEMELDSDDVYSCQSIIDRSLTTINGSRDDWALIKLDREVKGKRVLDIRMNDQPAIGTDLVVIGHPSGLPTKVAAGSTVTKLDLNFFYADLDTYGGNSGSAVFNAKTGLVEGILVRGNADYVTASGCRVSNVLSQGRKNSEGVSNISRLSKLIIDNR